MFQTFVKGLLLFSHSVHLRGPKVGALAADQLSADQFFFSSASPVFLSKKAGARHAVV